MRQYFFVVSTGEIAEFSNMVQKGFNSDVLLDGVNYHIQTEDWGRENPFLVSRVFRSGAVIKSIKTSYIEVLPDGLKTDEPTIRLALKLQHQEILDLLVSGHLIKE